jgi:hypothetical protein
LLSRPEPRPISLFLAKLEKALIAAKNNADSQARLALLSLQTKFASTPA